MAWTEITRPKYDRKGLRYTSDMTDSEWKSIEPHLPKPRKLGRPRQVDLRAVVEAIFYVATTGCQWANLPKDFPAKSTVQGYFYQWRDDGTWETLNHLLLLVCRCAPPSARRARPNPAHLERGLGRAAVAGPVSRHLSYQGSVQGQCRR